MKPPSDKILSVIIAVGVACLVTSDIYRLVVMKDLRDQMDHMHQMLLFNDETIKHQSAELNEILKRLPAETP